MFLNSYGSLTNQELRSLISFKGPHCLQLHRSSHFNGVSQVVLQLSIALRQLLPVTLLAPPSNPISQLAQQEGVPLFDPSTKPDLLHLHNPQDLPWAQTHFPDIPKIFTIHQPLTPSYLQDLQELLPSIQGVTTVSNWLKKELVKPFPQQEITEIPNFFSQPIWIDPPSTPKVPPFPLKLLWVGNLEVHKNPHQALDLLEEICRRGHEASLTLIGLGSLAQSLQETAQKRKLPVHQEGYLSPAKLRQELENHHWTLVTSPYETFSLLALQSLLSGTPVVTTSQGGIREVVGEDQGLLARYDRLEQITDKILELSHPSHYPSLLKASLKARHRFEPHALSQRWLHYYQTILKESP